MNKHPLHEKVIKEIELIPLEKLNEVYDFVRFLRMGLEKTKVNKEKILSFAGCWKDMPDEVFDNFIEEIGQRRREAFLRRRDETSTMCKKGIT